MLLNCIRLIRVFSRSWRINRPTKLEKFLKELERIPGVTDATGDYIPSPRPEAPPTLYINIIFREKDPNEDYHSLLINIREVARIIIKVAHHSLRKENHKGICLSFFHLPKPGQNIRLYRIAPARDELLQFAENKMVARIPEESSHPEIRKILVSPPSDAI